MATPTTPTIASPTSTIGPNMTVRGTIAGDEDVLVQGRVEGNVELDANLVVDPGAILEADLKVKSAEIRGQVKGEIAATESLLIRSGARIAGTVRAPRLEVEETSAIKGSFDMDVAIPDELLKRRSEVSR